MSGLAISCLGDSVDDSIRVAMTEWSLGGRLFRLGGFSSLDIHHIGSHDRGIEVIAALFPVLCPVNVASGKCKMFCLRQS
jgi:hypothetical protein